MRSWSWKDSLSVLFVVAVGALLVMGGNLVAGCTPKQAQIIKDAAVVADAACVLLVDTGAPDVVQEVCSTEQSLYPYVDDAVKLGTKAQQVEACQAAPESAPVVAVRRVDGKPLPGVVLRDRSVLARIRLARSGQDAGPDAAGED